MQNEVLRLSTQLLLVLSSNINCLNSFSLLASLRSIEEDSEQIERKHIIQLLQVSLRSVGNHVLSEPFCCTLIANILRNAIMSDLPVAVLQRGLQRALRSSLKNLQDIHSPLRIRIDWSDRQMVSSIIYGFLKHMVYALDDTEHAIDVVLKTFIATSRTAVQVTMHTGNSPPELRLQYHTIAGPATTFTTFYADTLLMDIPVNWDLQTDLASCNSAGLIVALFSCSLEIPTPTAGQTLQLTTKEHDKSTHEEMSAEYVLLQSFAQQVQRSHVGLVICQKRVHPYLQRQLRARGVLVLPRVSVRYMAALQALTGARVHASLPSLISTGRSVLDPKSLGFLHSISFAYKFGKPFVLTEGFKGRDGDGKEVGGKIQGEALQDHLLATFSSLDPAFLLSFVKGAVPRHRTFSTVLLTAPSETVLGKWKDAFEASMVHLNSLIPGPAYALRGAGVWQTYVAQQLRLQCRVSPNSTTTRVGRQLAEVQCMFAECLESSAPLQPSDRGDGIAVSMKFGHDRIALRLQSVASMQEAAHDRPVTAGTFHPNRLTGGSPEVHANGAATRRDEVAPLRENHLTRGEGSVALDGLQGSVLALQVAVDTACALLSVDGVVVLEPENT